MAKCHLIKNGVDSTIDYPTIGYDYPNIIPDYKQLKDYCDKHGIKDDDYVKVILIKE